MLGRIHFVKVSNTSLTCEDYAKKKKNRGTTANYGSLKLGSSQHLRYTPSICSVNYYYVSNVYLLLWKPFINMTVEFNILTYSVCMGYEDRVNHLSKISFFSRYKNTSTGAERRTTHRAIANCPFFQLELFDDTRK